MQDWVYLSLQVLVTACPCALVLSTPATVVCALARAAQRGVLIKGGAALESLRRVSAAANSLLRLLAPPPHMLGGAATANSLLPAPAACPFPACPPACLQVSVVTFDKTGTLTKGTFQVMSCEVGG